MNIIGNWFHHRKQKASVLSNLSRLLSISAKDMRTVWHGFDRFYQKQGYIQNLGESKTLNMMESFITYVILAGQQPASIVEIGTYYGKSTRRILDMKTFLRLAAPVTCYDISDNVKYFKHDEARLILKDITPITTKILAAHSDPKFIFLDARPYGLLKNVIMSCLNNQPDAILAIHDCSCNLCRREMVMDHSCPEITSSTGVWERHVLAECFNISDPLSHDLDDLATQTHRLMIFESDYGLALLVPKHQIRLIGDRISRFAGTNKHRIDLGSVL